MEKAKVYFTKNLTSESLIKLYKKANCHLEGKVAVKVHSGEEGNQNFLHPEYFKDIIAEADGIEYTLHLKVTEDMIKSPDIANPETSSTIAVVLGIISLLIIVTVYFKIKKEGHE